MLNKFILLLSIYLSSFSFLLSFEGDTHDFYLSNGLKVILQESHSFPRIAVNITYDIGSHDDPVGKKGLTNVMGYLMWQGSENYKKDEHYILIEETGGRASHNKWDIIDYLAFRNTTTIDYYDLMLKLEADRMRSLVINAETVAHAKDVAIYELEDLKTKPWLNLHEAISSFWPQDHPYASLGGFGTISDIQNISIEDCKIAYENYFTPNNAVLVVVGDIDPINSLEIINKYFGRIKPSNNIPVNPDLSFQIQPSNKLRTLQFGLGHRQYIRAYSIPTMRNNDSIILELLSNILRAKSSPLKQAIEIDEKFAIESWTWVDNRLGDSFFLFNVISNKYAPIRKSQKAVSDFIKKLKKNGLEEKYLNIAKKKLLREQMYHNYWTAQIAGQLAEFELIYGDYHKYTDQLELVKDISNEDIKRVANQYFINEIEIEMQPETNNIIKKIGYSIYYAIF